jgi:hypothetical protein
MNTSRLIITAASLLLMLASTFAHGDSARFCVRKDGVPPSPMPPGRAAVPTVDYASYCDEPGFTCTPIPYEGQDERGQWDCYEISTKGRLPQPDRGQPPPAPPKAPPAQHMPQFATRDPHKPVPGGYGWISICRTPGFTEFTDSQPVEIAPASTYAGGCDKSGNNCTILVAATQGATLAPGKSACATIAATIRDTDGKTLKHGDVLRAQWIVKGFTPTIKVVEDFK